MSQYGWPMNEEQYQNIVDLLKPEPATVRAEVLAECVRERVLTVEQGKDVMFMLICGDTGLPVHGVER